MALCGFNEKMLEGMDKFHEGLVETLTDKESIDNVMKENARETE